MTDKIPEYIDQVADEAISRIKNCRIDDNAVSFAFFAETHNCNTYVERSLYAINKINKTIPIKFICIGGDYLCNNLRTTHDEALSQLNDLSEIIKNYSSHIPTMVIKGNHDDNPFGKKENEISNNEIYDTIMSHHKDFFVSDSKNDKAMYGYYDMPDEKIRAIYLDVFELKYTKNEEGLSFHERTSYAISNDQLNFIANKALKLPQNDWLVVLFSHASPIIPPFKESEHIFGGDALIEILKAFKNGEKYSTKAKKGDMFYDVECDFTSQKKGEIAGYFCGHHHTDFTWNVCGIPFACVIQAASDNFSRHICKDGYRHLKVRGSGEESAFDIISINPSLRKVSCIRCGAGYDYSFFY